jgi:predicted nucleic acid-binding protein
VTSGSPYVYIDTNVFAYKLIPHPNYKGKLLTKADNFFKDIVSGKYKGVTSTFTELEYRGIIKKVLSDLSNAHVSNLQEMAALSDFRRFIRHLGIMITDADALSSDPVGNINIFSTSSPILASSVPSHFPHLKKNTWKSIGGADGITVNLAIRSNAQYFATFDRGFAGLNNAQLQPIIVLDVY